MKEMLKEPARRRQRQHVPLGLHARHRQCRVAGAEGLANTLKVTGTALAFGVPLGLALALLRLSPRRALSWPAGFVIEFFRTTPPLVQLFWFFFALPILIHVEMTPFVAAVLTFSIQSAAFFAEVFRGGIVSIEKGQWEAARAIGMNRGRPCGASSCRRRCGA